MAWLLVRKDIPIWSLKNIQFLRINIFHWLVMSYWLFVIAVCGPISVQGTVLVFKIIANWLICNKAITWISKCRKVNNCDYVEYFFQWQSSWRSWASICCKCFCPCASVLLLLHNETIRIRKYKTWNSGSTTFISELPKLLVWLLHSASNTGLVMIM